ncbi:conserved hypothetical protein [Paenibacillus curdlanolyticus YK9]|uniref:DUF2306 domain-containing protein n=1 Tax=Paenibacillus curdlanolyticus YK9 TaxID=717606 RepID=E0ICV8_9BACL|nr:DUF2306 domain-containing protein [Paenibacillus curdlanolyticus]EFM09673.1 conserved hypothetical protein [Paenibacillus curdlanolyticus YK9]
MSKINRSYALMLIVIAGFIGYVAYKNFVYDIGANAFLQHKTGRAVHLPVWLKVMNIHIGVASLAMVCGALNFLPALHARNRKLHCINGYVYVVSVMLVSLTSGYMAPYSTGGKAVSIAFNMLNIVWPAMTVIAIMRIRKKRLQAHREWMVRSYAYCFTNMLIHLITFMLHNGWGVDYVASYAISVYSSLLLLPLMAEAVNRRRRVSKG